nr:helicase-RNA polymerase [Tea plant necrotic ring blotch virus]
MTTIRADAFSTSRSLGEEFILTPKSLVELDDVSLTFGDLLERFLIEAPNLEYLGPEDTNLILRVRITELRSEFFANSSSHDYYRPSDAELANMKSLVYPPRFKKVPRDDLPVDIHESSLMGPAAFLRELNSMHYNTEPRNQVQDVPKGNDEEIFLDRSLEDVEIENIIDNTVLPTYAGEYMEIRLDPMLAVKEFLLYSRLYVKSMLHVPDCDKLVQKVSGVFIKGCVADLTNYRCFVDKRRKEVVFTSEYDSRRHTDIFTCEESRVCPYLNFSRLHPPVVENLRNKCLLSASFTQAGPGCGKTSRLISMAKNWPTTWLILTSNKRTAVEIDAKLGRTFKNRVFTLDSYVMHKGYRCDTLFIDEVTLSHPGLVYIAIALSSCSRAHGFGDMMQIGFVDRKNLMHMKYSNCKNFYPVIDTLKHSYRMPPEIAKALSPAYVSAGLGDIESLNKSSTSVSSYPLSKFKPSPRYKLLVFCRDDKKLFPDYDVSTVHEFQGCESDHVQLYCSRSSKILQNSLPHVIVALSRHRIRLSVYTDYDDTLLWNLVCSAKYGGDEISGGYTMMAPKLLGWVYKKPHSMITAPRSSSVPESWKDQDTLEIVRRESNENYLRVGQHALLRVDKSVSFKNFEETVAPMADVIIGRKLFIHDDAFSFEVHLAVRVLSKYKPRSIRVKSDPTAVSNEVFEFAQLNALMPGYQIEPLIEDRFEVDEKPDDSDDDVDDADTSDHLDVVQSFVDNLYTTDISRYNNEFDEFNFHHSDQVFPIDNIKFCEVRGTYEPSKFDKMRPALITPCPRVQMDTNINAFHSALKRNLQVPKLTTVDDTYKVAERKVDELMGLCKGICTDYMAPSVGSMQDWLNDQPNSIVNQLELELAIHDRDVSWYSFMLKRCPKPELTPAAYSSYPAVQTILCQDKEMNMYFCPVFRELRDRIIATLDKRILFFTKCDDEGFSKLLNERLPVYEAENYNCAEFDMSKYDKSQGLLVLLIECMLLERLGAGRLVARLWFMAHACCKAVNPATGLMIKTVFQRKSGDASTYIGNTIILLLSILDVVPIKDIALLLCSGDDSLLWTSKSVKSINFDVLTRRYNFEVKLFDFKYHYFCSKFILPVCGKWCIVPDPLKRAVKLGRSDLANEEHVEEYRISFRDNVRIYRSFEVAYTTSLAIQERYKTEYNSVFAILAMYQLSKQKHFGNLFYTEPGDVLCLDPSRSKLDM